MEFDKTRVYTALNAEDLPIGSKCIFANTLKELKEGIYENHIDTLFGIMDERYSCRFVSDNGRKSQFALAYLIEPPAEPKYKPFESVEQAMEAIKKHGGWVKEKSSDDLKIVTHISKSSDSFPLIGMGASYYSSKCFLDDCVFADDCSPCGELVEE